MLSLFFIVHVWLGAGRETENYRRNIGCISVFEIERRLVDLCTSITAGIAANAQLTFFVC